MYLDWYGEWRLPPFNGIAAAPLLQDSGEIRTVEGYDPTSGMWCEKVPDLTGLIPDRPTKDCAAKALLLIREAFKTFCFADSETRPYDHYDPYDSGCFGHVNKSEISIVDTTITPGKDESAFLVRLLLEV